MKQNMNILLVGVGGQGTILASKILSDGLIDAGYDVKMSEIHGMSQRGGNVSTQIRFGEQVSAPIIGKGSADVIVAFEKMEALRWIEYLRKEGKMIVNDYEIPSVPIQMGKVPYPDGILENLRAKADVSTIEAGKMAAEVGNMKTMNIVLLGALVKAMQLPEADWQKAIEANVKPAFLKVNSEAFKLGYDSVVA